MKTLNYNNQQYQADKIIKTDTNIIGQDINGNEVFAFRGISDFMQFKLTDESGNTINFDIDNSNIQTQTIANLVLQNATLQEQVQTLSNTVAQLMLGGGTNA